MASRQLLKRLAFREVALSQLATAAPSSAPLTALTVQLAADAKAPGQAAARHFARHFMPVLAYAHNSETHHVATKVTKQADNSTPRVIAEFGDGKKISLEASKHKDSEIFSIISGVAIPADDAEAIPTGVQKLKEMVEAVDAAPRGYGRPKRTTKTAAAADKPPSTA